MHLKTIEMSSKNRVTLRSEIRYTKQSIPTSLQPYTVCIVARATAAQTMGTS